MSSFKLSRDYFDNEADYVRYVNLLYKISELEAEFKFLLNKLNTCDYQKRIEINDKLNNLEEYIKLLDNEIIRITSKLV